MHKRWTGPFQRRRLPTRYAVQGAKMFSRGSFLLLLIDRRLALISGVGHLGRGGITIPLA